MKNILDAPFLKGMMKTTANMYRLGWDERNGGNISMMLDSDEVAQYLDINSPIRTIEMGFDAKVLSEILGHSTVKITLDRYVHPSLERKRQCMELLS